MIHHRFAVVVAQSEDVCAPCEFCPCSLYRSHPRPVVSTAFGDRLRITHQSQRKSGDESPHSKTRRGQSSELTVLGHNDTNPNREEAMSAVIRSRPSGVYPRLHAVGQIRWSIRPQPRPLSRKRARDGAQTEACNLKHTTRRSESSANVTLV